MKTYIFDYVHAQTNQVKTVTVTTYTQAQAEASVLNTNTVKIENEKPLIYFVGITD